MVWYFASDERLSYKVRDIIKKAENNEVTIVISVIVLLEALDIQEKKRIDFDIEKLFDFIENHSGFRVMGLDFDNIKPIVNIGKGLDLHDRVILSLGKILNSPILTKDKEIAEAWKTIW